MFNGQPVALVLAEDSEAARFAATLVAVEYDKQAHFTTDIERRCGERSFRRWRSPPSPAAMPHKALAAATVQHEAEYFVPIEHHNPMELFASTAIWEGGGKLTVYDKTQGVQNVQKYLCGVFGMKPDDIARDVALHGRRLRLGPASAITSACLRLLGARAEALGAPRAHAPADVRASATGRLRSSASRSARTNDGTLDAMTHEAVTITSHYEDFHAQ